MGSTGEPDRKRRLSGSFAQGVDAAPPAKRPALPPSSDDKKLDFAVIKYRNQKLSEQLEVHKSEYHALEGKFDDLKQKQKSHHETQDLVNKSWQHLVRDLKDMSVCKSGSQNSSCSAVPSNVSTDGACIRKDEDFLSRLGETGATESSGCHLEKHACSSTTDVLQNILFSSNDSRQKLPLDHFAALPEDERIRELQSTASEISLELNDAIQALGDLHLKHRQLTEKHHEERYLNARRKAEQKRLKEELTSAVAELEESNHKLAVLKAQGDTTHGTPILFPTLGNKSLHQDNVRDKQKELQDLGASHKEFTGLISQRLVEIRRLHEERIAILNKLATFQNTLTDLKSISSSKAFQVLKDQLQKSQAELDHCRALLEKLQVNKDKLIWQEREINVKVDLSGILYRVSLNCESNLEVLDQNLGKVVDEKNMLAMKLEESSREPDRNQIISEFKALVSSLPGEMGAMQTELSKYKDDASELHSLRAEVRSISDILARNEHAINKSLCKSSRAGSEVCELRQTNCELKLFVEMYKRESTDSRDVLESKYGEYCEWAHVHSLKFSLDDNRLEQRVKAAIEAEATSQQKLASGEAEIAELRGKMESARRDIGNLSELLKSKHEEGEAYLSEIESIGQAYEDIQTQNQQLLQQIIERDDHNTKIFMEGVKVKQAQDTLHLEVCNLNRNLRQAKNLMDLYKDKIAQLDDKLKVWSEQTARLSEDERRHSVSSGNAQRKLADVQGEVQQLRESMDQVQSKVGRSRLEVAGLLVELEKDRFSKRRIEDDLESLSRKASSLRAKTQASSVLEKIHQEVSEYRGILKCGVCRDRQKEVVITKCYHLFCNDCIQKLLRNRQRRCPSCALSFGANDVKPIYI
ncbi:E3 ubiquitin-protein ligase BRE1-like 1 isoform X2 [Hordeum vulgare subsp. vulgare]|uniref:E3 ubiquitin-protein ligase BRE1-like 1 isoform X2 n=1 Tax=Hordeum vulgare subsp. vulgare TaxID=112509 RepID=UPI001D1A4D7C|nr:E3 ubiquitin-protein ligase BRE1-like 1 isoform X2 [Hordeum vulgare subsp. vulgare]